jgi:hypothetical protein
MERNLAMSHNLYFRKVRPNGYVEFPFQTPTALSRSVMAVSNNHDRLSLIEQYLYDCQWGVKAIDEMIKRIYNMMTDENLTLEIN